MHAGPVGAGHFAKMVHNGIEYGMMQAYAEGYELLAGGRVVEDVPGVIKSWTHGTVIRSWLLDLLVLALEADPELAEIQGYVEDSGEGRWTVEEAINHAVPLPVITAALFARFASRQDDSPAMKAVAALRNQFGGHAVTKVAKGRGREAGLTGVHVAHLSLTRLPVLPRRSSCRWSRASPRSSAPTGRARPTWSRRSAISRRWARHRVAADAPLVRLGAERAVVRGAGPPRRPRAAGRAGDHPGQGQPGAGQPVAGPAGRATCSASCARVLFAPEDLALVKGDPSERRRFLDDLLVAAGAPLGRGPRRLRPGAQAAQRPAQVAGASVRAGRGDLRTLEVWDAHLAAAGAELLAARLDLVDALRPLVDKAYDAVADTGTSDGPAASTTAARSADDVPLVADRDLLAAAIANAAGRRCASSELDRGISLVGPHRDDLRAQARPAARPRATRATASPGRSRWRCGWRPTTCCAATTDGGGEPVLVLDDVFAELDTGRRERLAERGRGRRAGAGHRGRARRRARGARRVRGWT